MAGSTRASAIGWMLVTGLLFVAVTGIDRHLGSDLPAVQAAFIRYVIGLGFMLPFLWRTLRVRLIPRRPIQCAGTDDPREELPCRP